MEQVRLGVIGCGGSMATHHQKYFKDITGLKYVAACDVDPDALKRSVEEYDVKGFDKAEDLITSGEVDAVLIATPHYDHPRYGMLAFENGVHVLTEKPVAVTAKAAEEINEAHKAHPELVYAAMFQQRTQGNWKTVKRLIDEGQVGDLVRASWTITDWFRSQAYYNSGGWRATWKGEGGGVLINQCPHNLDLFQWFVGMPAKVQAMVSLGKYHDIEVEDYVTAMLEFPNGAVGTFITTTAEAPGVNRLEIVGEKGTIIADDKIRLLRNHQPTTEYSHTTTERFARVGCDTITFEPGRLDSGHHVITRNFVNAILHGEELIARGEEGINGLELGNAMLMAGLTNKPVPCPTDRDAFDAMIKDLAKNSTFKKKEVKPTAPVEMGSSF